MELKIDFRNHDAASRHDDHKAISRETLQRLSNRRAPDFQLQREGLLRQHSAGRQPKRDDHFFEFVIGAIRQRPIIAGGLLLPPRNFLGFQLATHTIRTSDDNPKHIFVIYQ